MKKRDDIVRKRVDAVDETILLALKEGQKSLGNLSTLAGLNYNTCRQRLDKLLRYNYLAKPRYGEYALSENGRRFVEELTLPVAPDLKDAKLKKLIDMLPTELHRAFFRLTISGVIAKYLLFQLYDDGYPGFIMGGRTRGFKTALGNVLCRIFGLRPERNIYPLYLATPGEFGVRRLRSKAARGFDFSESPYFNESFMVFDEFDKVGDKDIRRNVLFFLDGRAQFTIEGKLIQNHACTMVTLNTNLRKEGLERFGIPEPYIRRCVVADTEYVETELQNVDLVAKEIFELKDFPRISLKRLQINRTKLSDAEFNSLRNLLMACTQDEFKRLVDTRPLGILALGRSALLDGDVREAMYQTIWDRLVCLESLGGTVAGWRERVTGEWVKYKREELPEIAKQLEEANQREKERTRALTERAAVIEEKKVERIDDQIAFILHRAELSYQVQKLIQELGRGEPLTEPLRWLRKNIDSSRTPKELNQYEESFNKSTLPKVKLRLQEKRNAEEQAKREKETAKWVAGITKEIERKAEIRKKEQKQKEREQRKDEILKLRACLKQINYYLGRKELREGEDPVLTLQQVQIVQPVEGSRFLKVSNKPVKGDWLRDRWSGKLKYSPPLRDFIDYGATIQLWSNEVTKGKLYKWFREVQYWTSWTNVWPLLQAKRAQILGEIAMLAGNKNMEKR